MPRHAISVENLGKAYRIGLKEEIPDTFTGALTGWMKSPLTNWKRLRRLNTFGTNEHDAEDTIWALKDVSFEVPEGEVLGIIGRNGAGKSTLLKILSRITEPTEGRVRMRGRVSSLLEVGTGFHPELSGRENVYMNGTILGMTKREIDRKFDEIVEFSGVGRFLDTPIKRYSSGMKVRLAFAVAAHLEPEILIIDEVLAVGDAEFQKKCLGKMQDVAGSGRTALFVSHNMPAVRSLCSHSALINSGRLQFIGNTAEAIQHHLQQSTQQVNGNNVVLDGHPGRTSKSRNVVKELCLPTASTTSPPQLTMLDPLVLHITFNNAAPIHNIVAGIVVRDSSAEPVFGVNSLLVRGLTLSAPTGTGTIVGTIPDHRLMPGVYTIDVFFGANGTNDDVIERAISFEITSEDVFGTGKLPPSSCGSTYCHSTWASL